MILVEQSELQVIYYFFLFNFLPNKKPSIHRTSKMSRENPVAAVFLSWAMVELFLLMGSLNQIAQLRELYKCAYLQ